MDTSQQVLQVYGCGPLGSNHQKVEKYREEDMELRDIHTLLVAMQINIAAVENCKSFLKN